MNAQYRKEMENYLLERGYASVEGDFRGLLKFYDDVIRFGWRGFKDMTDDEILDMYLEEREASEWGENGEGY